MLSEEDYKDIWKVFKCIADKEFFTDLDESSKRAFDRCKKNNRPITTIVIDSLKNKLEYFSEKEKEIYHLFVYLRYKLDQESSVSVNAFNKSRDYLKKVNSKYYKKSQLYRKHKTSMFCIEAIETMKGHYIECKNDFFNGLEKIRKKLGFSEHKFAKIFKMSSYTYYAYLNNQREIREQTKFKAVRRLNESIYSNKEYTVEMIEELGRNK